MEHIGTWWNSRDIELVKVDGKVYALDGWNGEKYLDCWECKGEHLTEASGESYTLEPIYRHNVEGVDVNELEENSEEWNRAAEVVDYDVNMNYI